MSAVRLAVAALPDFMWERGRQELDGELIEEVEGALRTRALIEECRAGAPEMLAPVPVEVRRS